MTSPGTPEAQLQAGLRAPRMMASLLLGAMVVALLPLIPGVPERIGVTVLDTGIALGAFALVSLSAAVAFWTTGTSRLYWALAISESWVTALGGLYLVWASGNPTSFFWLIFASLVMVNALESARRRVEDAVFFVGPGLLAAGFMARGDLGAAGISLTIGVILAAGLVLFRLIFVRLREATQERDRLRAEVAELRLREERQRISRDLHDGLGAELASLTWSARSLHRRLSGTGLESEAGQLIERVRSGADELRSVVWALRSQERGWDELVARIAARSAELAAGTELSVTAQPTEEGPRVEGHLALHFLRSAQELVHNAVRHAGATRIRVELIAAGSELRCTVEDDGRGLPPRALEDSEGGLRNLRQRARLTGGELRCEPRERGTRITLAFPLPAPSHMFMQ